MGDVEESRRPLQAEQVRSGLRSAGWTGPDPVVLTAPASTEDGLAVLRAEEAADLSSVVLESWTGRLGRFDGARLPAGSALVVSVLVTGEPGRDEAGWVSLLGTLAAADALRAAAQVNAETAWPDGLTVPGAMCGGSAGSLELGAVEVDRVDRGWALTLVVAVGVPSGQLPAGTSSTYAEGGSLDRAGLLAGLLAQLTRRTSQWRAHDPALAADYRARCQTMGRLLELAEGRGTATGVDAAGDLVVDVAGRVLTVHRPLQRAAVRR